MKHFREQECLAKTLTKTYFVSSVSIQLSRFVSGSLNEREYNLRHVNRDSKTLHLLSIAIQIKIELI